jgi:hypothetical protein
MKESRPSQPPSAPSSNPGVQKAGRAAEFPGLDLGFSVFFAKVPPKVSALEIVDVFSRAGEVVTINLFRPWPNSISSKVSSGAEGAPLDAFAKQCLAKGHVHAVLLQLASKPMQRHGSS